MGSPVSFFKSLSGMARDYPRDRMPEGYVWDLADYVPTLLDAALTGRGAWSWYSAAHPAGIEGGIHAPFKSGDKLITIAGGNIYEVNVSTGAVSPIAGGTGLSPIKQNPVMHRDRVIIFDGVNLPKIVTSTPAFAVAAAPATAKAFKYGSVYKDRVIGANYPGEEQQIRFSPVGNPTTDWDVNSYWNTSLPLTGIGALRAVILLFHQGSVERIRGSTPPSTLGGDGDMSLENMFDRAGCGDARSIAYWNDNCIFADERGVHLTDGAIVRNLISQGGMLTFWRTLFRNRQTITAASYLDFYITTIVRTDGGVVTLICDLPKRAWFRFTNIKAISYIQSVGEQERLWAGIEPDHRLAALADCFFPPLTLPTSVLTDANGVAVLPLVETPWYRMAQEGRKRSRFVYTSYDSRIPPGATAMGWRADIDQVAQQQSEAAVQAVQQMLEVGYMTSPNEQTYTIAGRLPDTQRYKRYRLPIGMHPYGIAFRIRQIAPSTVTRVFDFAVEAAPEERSRV